MATTLTIADAAKVSGLSAHALRYYERAGLLEPIDRNRSGHRRYRDEDLERIRFLTRDGQEPRPDRVEDQPLPRKIGAA